MRSGVIAGGVDDDERSFGAALEAFMQGTRRQFPYRRRRDQRSGCGYWPLAGRARWFWRSWFHAGGAGPFRTLAAGACCLSSFTSRLRREVSSAPRRDQDQAGRT